MKCTLQTFRAQNQMDRECVCSCHWEGLWWRVRAFWPIFMARKRVEEARGGGHTCSGSAAVWKKNEGRKMWTTNKREKNKQTSGNKKWSKQWRWYNVNLASLETCRIETRGWKIPKLYIGNQWVKQKNNKWVPKKKKEARKEKGRQVLSAWGAMTRRRDERWKTQHGKRHRGNRHGELDANAKDKIIRGRIPGRRARLKCIWVWFHVAEICGERSAQAAGPCNSGHNVSVFLTVSITTVYYVQIINVPFPPKHTVEIFSF